MSTLQMGSFPHFSVSHYSFPQIKPPRGVTSGQFRAISASQMGSFCRFRSLPGLLTRQLLLTYHRAVGQGRSQAPQMGSFFRFRLCFESTGQTLPHRTIWVASKTDEIYPNPYLSYVLINGGAVAFKGGLPSILQCGRFALQYASRSKTQNCRDLPAGGFPLARE